MKKNECERVIKMRACEIWATSIDADYSQHCERDEKRRGKGRKTHGGR